MHLKLWFYQQINNTSNDDSEEKHLLMKVKKEQ